MTGDVRDLLTVTGCSRAGAAVLTVRGVLDGRSYRDLRDEVIMAALDGPGAVIVDVTDLAVPAASAWVVFASARRHVDRWPGVPIELVCESRQKRAVIARHGVTRHVPVHATMESALGRLRAGSARGRRCATEGLPAEAASVRRSREMVERWLTAWSHDDAAVVAKVVVTALVENVLEHTDSAPTIRLESDGAVVSVAVEDSSRAQAVQRETSGDEDPSTGLRIVTALSRHWGNAPTPSGKTVWAIIGPENRL